MRSAKPLQVVLCMLAALAVVTGLLSITGLSNPLYTPLSLPRAAVLDTQLRFFAGLWVGLGISVLAAVRNLQKHYNLYLALYLMGFLGGVGRLLSLIEVGMPPVLFAGSMLMELVGIPLLAYWHYSLRRLPTST